MLPILATPVQAQLFLNVNKSFNPINLNVGATSSLIITFANTSPSNSATSITGTDTLPSGLAFVNAGVGTCSFAPTVSSLYTGGARLNWSGGIIPPASTCTVTAVVTPVANGTFVNTIPTTGVSGFVATQTVSGFADAQATITANGTFAPITGTKSASTSPLHGGGTRSFTIVLNNPNAVPTGGVGYTDTLPASLVVAVPGGVTANTCGGTIADTGGTALGDGDAGFMLAGGTLNANASCLITVVVRAANNTTFQAANSTNTIPANGVTTTLGITNAAAITANLRIEKGVSTAKVFAPTTILAGGTSLLTITLNNFNLASIPNATITDAFPAGVTGVSFAGANASCGAPTVNVTGPSAVITNATLAGAPNPNANGAGVCTITIVVTAPAAGLFTNNLPAGVMSGGFTYAASTANLTVNNPPASITGTKGFAPASVPQGGTSLFTITLSNSGATSATNTSFTDNLLTTMGGSVTIAATPIATNSCGGTLTANAGTTTVTLSGGTIGPTSSCVITVPVQTAFNAATGARTNSLPAGAVSTSLGTNSVAINGVLTITADIAVTKVFSPNSIPQTASSLLTITLSNAAGGANASITSFTETLATMGTGTFIGPSPAATNTCGGALSAVPGSTTISLVGGAITAGGNCQIILPVIVAGNATTSARTNTVPASNLKTNQGNNSNAATAVLTITSALGVAKAFVPLTIGSAQVSRLTITVTHALGAVAFTGLALKDVFPAGHTVASPANAVSTCGGVLTTTPGSGSVTLAGVGLPTGATSCAFALDVQSPAGTGASGNTIAIGSVTTAEGVFNVAAANSTLTRASGVDLTLNKDFTPPNINSGANSVLRVVIVNSNAYPVTGLNLTDAMPAGMRVAATPGGSTTCSAGTVVAVAGQASVSLSGGTIPASGNCQFSVNVTSATGGNSINTIPVGTLTSVQSVTNSNSPSATLQVLFNINIGKVFSPDVTLAGLTTSLVVTVYNANTTTVSGNAVNALTDNLPAGLEVGAVPASNGCGGTVTNGAGAALAVGATSFRLNGGTFNPGTSCDIGVVVRTTPAGATGTFLNTIAAGALATSGGTNPTPASASVTFVAQPTIVKSFNPASTISGGQSTLTFTLGNPNSAALFPAGLTSVRLTDTLPAGLGIYAPDAAGGGCIGASGNSFSAGQAVLVFSGLSIAPQSSCTLTVVVTAPSVGVYVNTVSGVVSAQTISPSTSVSTATLTVLAAPGVSKAFSPSALLSGGTGTTALTITLSNSNATPVSIATPGVLDVFPTSPGAMTLFSALVANSCGGTVQDSGGGALNAGDVGIRMNGGAIPASGSCTITAIVQMPLAGTYLNNMPSVTSTNAGSSAQGATASVTITPSANLSVSKTDGLLSVTAGQTTTYSITVTNAGPADATGVVVQDPIATGLSCTQLVCNAIGGATCPSLNLALLQGSGLSIPVFPSGGQVVFGLTCGVTATGL